MILDVLICCYNESINTVSNILLKPRTDVQYIISHQYNDSIYNIVPDSLYRNDVLVVKNFGKGLSKNRNIAFEHAQHDICLIADDDVRYTDSYFDTIINEHKINNDKDVIVFKIKPTDSESEFKPYPKNDYLITPKNLKHYISSIEITFKRKRFLNKNISFDERFGLGSKYFNQGGEEEILIFDCLKKGLKIYFINKYIVEHSFISTGRLNLQLPQDKKARFIIAFFLRTRGPLFIASLIKNHKNILPSINIIKVLSFVFSTSLVLLFTNKNIISKLNYKI